MRVEKRFCARMAVRAGVLAAAVSGFGPSPVHAQTPAVRPGSAPAVDSQSGPVRRLSIDDAVAKLQIDGSSAPLEGPVRTDTVEAPAGALVVALTPLVAMTWGKLAAQTAHGAQLAREAAGEATLAAWAERDRAIVVWFPTAEAWARDVPAEAVRVRDGGFTEIPPGTLTAAAWFASTGSATVAPTGDR